MMRYRKKILSLSVILLLVAVVLLSGCIGTVPSNTNTLEPTNNTEERTDSHPEAELLRFERLDSECIDNTGMGEHITTNKTTAGDLIIINQTIKTNDPAVKLTASLLPNASSATNWTLAVTGHGNETDATTCTGRVQYQAVIKIQNTPVYNITFLYNDDWTGNVFRDEHSGGGSGVAYAPPSNNTTVTMASTRDSSGTKQSIYLKSDEYIHRS